VGLDIITATPCISSAAGCILFRNDDIQGFRLGDIPQQVADDMHACGVIWYVSSSPYKNSPKYLFHPPLPKQKARRLGCLQ